MVRVVFLLLLLFFSNNSQAQDLTLSGGVINTANDYQVGHENWARVKFEINNKSNRVRHVKVQFKHSTVLGGVYEFELSVQPQTQINHYFPVAMGSAAHTVNKNQKSSKNNKNKKKRISKAVSTYKLLLLEKSGDRYLPVKGVKPIDCVMDFRDFRTRTSIALITDQPLEIGNLTKRLGLDEGAIHLTFLNRGKWPEHWSEYSSYDALIFLDPVFEGKHSMAIQALKDYAKIGGTVIFAHPNSINNAARTQFEELLPVYPLQNRQINEIPSLQKFLKSKDIYSETGMTFVDSIAKKDTYVPCSWNEFPVVAWKKFGLGLTGAIMISPSADGFQNSDAFAKTWAYLIDNIKRPSSLSSLQTNDSRETVNMLNGLTIPGPSVILGHMLIYLILIAAETIKEEVQAITGLFIL